VWWERICWKRASAEVATTVTDWGTCSLHRLRFLLASTTSSIRISGRNIRIQESRSHPAEAGLLPLWGSVPESWKVVVNDSHLVKGGQSQKDLSTNTLGHTPGGMSHYTFSCTFRCIVN
jgi:hypothetical protein